MTASTLEYDAPAALPAAPAPSPAADAALRVWDDVQPTVARTMPHRPAPQHTAPQPPVASDVSAYGARPDVIVQHGAPQHLVHQHQLAGAPAGPLSIATTPAAQHGAQLPHEIAVAHHLAGHAAPPHHGLAMHPHGAGVYSHLAGSVVGHIVAGPGGVPVHVAVREHGGMYPQVLAAGPRQAPLHPRPLLAPQPARRDHVFGLAAGLLILAVLLTGGVAMERGTVPKPKPAAAASTATAATSTPQAQPATTTGATTQPATATNPAGTTPTPGTAGTAQGGQPATSGTTGTGTTPTTANPATTTATDAAHAHEAATPARPGGAATPTGDAAHAGGPPAGAGQPPHAGPPA